MEPFRGAVGSPALNRRTILTRLAGWSAAAPTMYPLASIRPTIVCGPYLQCGTSHSIIVRWRTDRPTTGQVHYGTTPDQLRHIAGHTAHTTEHLVQVGNLTPNTRYYYRIMSEDIALTTNGTDHSFVTSPSVGQAKQTRVLGHWRFWAGQPSFPCRARCLCRVCQTPRAGALAHAGRQCVPQWHRRRISAGSL